jgi:hypothetical protein
VREFLRNAFALDDGKPCEPSDDERAVLDRVVDEVVRRRLSTPAIAFLEMSRPLNVVGAAAIHFFTPIAAVLANPLHLRRFADFLERRGSVDYLCRMIERAEQARLGACCEGAEPSEADTTPDDSDRIEPRAVEAPQESRATPRPASHGSDPDDTASDKMASRR